MFLPLKDYNPVGRPAVIVPVLIAINVFVFLFIQPTIGASERDQEAFMFCRAAIPFEVTRGHNLVDAADQGEVPGTRIRTTNDPRVEPIDLREECPQKSVLWSILASMFFHGGFLHIAGNMLFLWVFGNNVEDSLGRVKFVIFYLLCGVIATLAQSYVSRNEIIPMVGASGAIAGVLGAYLIMFPRAPVRNLVIFFFITMVDLPAFVVLGIWFVLQVFQGVGDVAPGSGVAYMAHIGGFLAGMILLLVFRPRPKRQIPVVMPYDPF